MSKRYIVPVVLVFIGVISCCAFVNAWLFPRPKICTSELSKHVKQLNLEDILPPNENVELVGHIGGAATSIFIRGSYAYAKIGPELTIFDISNPTHPLKVGFLIQPGRLLDVDSTGNYAYILGNGLWRIDLSDPTKPNSVHLYSIPLQLKDIQIADGKAYITLERCKSYLTIPFVRSSLISRCQNGVHIIDLSIPTFSSVPTNCYEGYTASLGFVKKLVEHLVNIIACTLRNGMLK